MPKITTEGRYLWCLKKKLDKIKYSSIAQLAERMTVNHDVAGSSPAGGATFLIRRTRKLFV